MATTDTAALIDRAPQIYATTRDQLVAVLRACSDEQVATLLPACPEWTARDIAAHLSGLVAEILAGVEPPLGSDEATTRQVNDRAGQSLAQICDEWQRNADAIFEVMGVNDYAALGLGADLTVHAHDIYEGLGIDPADTADASMLGAHRYSGLLQERVAERLGAALTIELIDVASYPPPNPDGMPGITLRASAHEFLRAVTGRRSRSEVHAMHWSSDPTTLIDQAWRQYGEFPDT